MKSVFEKIGEENNVSAEEVEKEIMKAIDYARKNGNQQILKIPKAGNELTPTELVAYLSNYVAVKQNRH